MFPALVVQAAPDVKESWTPEDEKVQEPAGGHESGAEVADSVAFLSRGELDFASNEVHEPAEFPFQVESPPKPHRRSQLRVLALVFGGSSLRVWDIAR
jgi:hypothetical protein